MRNLDRADVPNEYPNLAKVFPNKVIKHHPLNPIILNGSHIPQQRAYLSYIDELLQNIFEIFRNYGNAHIAKALSDELDTFRNPRNFESALANLEVMNTLHLNGYFPLLIPRSDESRTPDIETRRKNKFAVEVTTARPNETQEQISSLREAIKSRIKSRLPDGLDVEIDVRNVSDRDRDRLASKIAKQIPQHVSTFGVDANGTIKEIHESNDVDISHLGNGNDICVIRVTNDWAWCPLNTKNVFGTTLKNAFHSKRKRRQHLPGMDTFLVIDLTPARHELMGFGFGPAIRLIYKEAEKSCSIFSAIVLRCTGFRDDGEPYRTASVAWAKKPEKHKQIRKALRESGELPNPW